MVAAGILLSRIVGLVRNRVFAHYFGTSDAADAFNAAFRIPNFLQNLFGEGVLSASFIPVYAGLLRARRTRTRRGRVAGAVAALLALVTVACSCWSACCSRRGSSPSSRRASRARSARSTIRLVRILFPGAGLLVLSAWCLGVLNSHRRFFLCYAAPVLWNLAIIARAGRLRAQHGAAIRWRRSPPGARWSAALLQFGVQLPTVLRLLGGLRPRLRPRLRRRSRRCCATSARCSWAAGSCRSAPTSTPCSPACCPPAPWRPLLRAGALHAAGEPVRHVGLGGRAAGHVERGGRRGRARGATSARGSTPGLRQIAFFVVPSAVAFLALGDVVAGALYQSGAFTASDDGVRLGHPRRLGRRAARVDAGPAVRLDLLRAARHPHAAPLRRRPGRAHDRAGLPLRAAAAAARWARAALGRGRASPPRPASPAGSSSCCSAAALNRRIGTTGAAGPR